MNEPTTRIDRLEQTLERLEPALAEFLVKANGREAGSFEKNKSATGEIFQAARESARSILVDPYLWTQGNPEYQRRPSRIDWKTLKRMSNTPLLSAIINTRIGQVIEFMKPQENRYLPGYQIRLRNVRRHPTRVERRMCEDLTKWVQQCGVVTDRRQLVLRQGIVPFSKAVLRDSLSMDQGTGEIMPTRGSRLRDGAPVPAKIQWVDASTIRIAQEALQPHGLPEDDYDTPRFVQVIEDTPVAEYEPWRLMFGVRNPTTSIYRVGYGFSELEQMVRILTAWMNAFDRNFRYFTQGFNARGFLNIKTQNGQAVQNSQLRNLRRQLQLLATGVQGAHRLPITQGEGLEFVNLGNEAQDMQWSDWADLNVKLACALFLMDPSEINFTYGNTGQSAAMGNASMAEKVEESRARGLVPLVNSYTEWWNRWIIWQIDPDFEMVATGTGRRDEKDELELDKMRSQFLETTDEIRARWDMPPVPSGGGDYIAEAQHLQAAQMASAEEEGGEEAEPLDYGDLEGEELGERTEDSADAGQEGSDVLPTKEPLAASRRSWRTIKIDL